MHARALFGEVRRALVEVATCDGCGVGAHSGRFPSVVDARKTYPSPTRLKAKVLPLFITTDLFLRPLGSPVRCRPWAENGDCFDQSYHKQLASPAL